MTDATLTGGQSAADIQPVMSPTGVADGCLTLEFASEAEARHYASVLVALFFDKATSCVASHVTGGDRDDLEPSEIAVRLRAGSCSAVRLDVDFGGGLTKVAVDIDPEHAATCTVRFPVESRPWTSVLWLQVETDGSDPATVLGLPVTSRALTLESVHGLVATAAKTGGFVRAALAVDGTIAPLGRWQADRPSTEATPIVDSPNLSLWTAEESTSREGQPPAWFVAEPAPPYGELKTPTPDWWARFDQLTAAASDCPRGTRHAGEGIGAQGKTGDRVSGLRRGRGGVWVLGIF